MLIKLENKDFAKYVDWAYNLALDISRSSYPTYTDGIKSKEDFINIALKSLSDPNREILLFLHGGQVLGWINYYIIPEDKYIGLEAFNTEKHTKIAIKEFEAYCKKRFRGYTLYLGFSSENEEAVSCLKENSYNLLETSYPNIFHFKDYKPLKCSDKIVKIEKENYSLFEKLHKAVDADMFWNSQRIFDNLSNWQILYYSDEKVQCAVYFTGKRIMEIFGVDFSDKNYDTDVLREMIIKCMNICHSLGAEHLYYFSEKDEDEILLKLGFKCLGQYNCFSLCLS